MPAEAATVIDRATFLKAVTWSLEYLLDPKRGQSKNLPTDKELKEQFAGGQNLSLIQISQWIYSKFGTNDLAKISQEQEKIKGVLDEISQELATPKEAAVPKFTTQDLAAARTARGRPSALGILAELEAIEPLLRKHQQEVQIKLTQSLKPKVREILPALGIKSTNEEDFLRIVDEVSQETARQTLNDAARIQLPGDTTVVVADSLRQNLVAHPQFGNQITQTGEEIIQKVSPQIQDVVAQNQEGLEQIAVLSEAVKIVSLSPHNPEVQNLISKSVEDAVWDQSALLEPQARETLKTEVANAYLESYKKAFFNNLKIGKDSIPTLNQLQQNKDFAHNQASKIGDYFSKTPQGKSIAGRVSPQKVTSNVAQTFNLVRPKPQSPQIKIPLVARVILSNPKRYKDLYFTALAHDQENLAQALKENSNKIAVLKKKKSLTYKDRKELEQAQTNYTKYTGAQAFKIKKSKKYEQNLKFLARIYNGRPELASQQIWQSEYYVQQYMPRIFASNERLSAGAAWGKLGFNISSFNIGSMFSNIKAEIGAASIMTGMGITTNSVTGILKKVRNISGIAFGGLLMYFYTLGQAAFVGFVAGGLAGGIAGAAVGFLAPPILWPITVPLGFFTGGIIGGTAGGLIGLGLASGSTTAVTTGIGAGVGGVTGAVIGGTLGSALGPVGTLVGATAGAYIGAFIGGALGYLFGHYVLGSTVGAIGFGAAVGFYLGGPLGAAIGAGIGWLATGGWVQIKNFFAGTPSAVAGAGAGFFGAAASFFTGLASTIWGGLSAGGGIIVGFFGGAANFIVGGLGSLAVPASAAAIPVAGSIGAVAVGGTIVSIVTAATFFNPEVEGDIGPGLPPPGETEFLKIDKSASPQTLSEPGGEITFTIVITAKTDLTNVQVTDELKVTTSNSSFTVNIDKESRAISPIPCPSQLAAGNQCTYSFKIVTDERYRDSIISNTAEVTALSGGQSVRGYDVAPVTVGNPPAGCPRGWPAIGQISQGPEGHTSHSSARFGEYEALDITQGIGNPVYATIDGTVTEYHLVSNADQRVGIKPTSCPGLEIVYYWHLSAVSVPRNTVVRWGQEIGRTGAFLLDGVPQPHIHYQFNRRGDRSFKIAPPYVPAEVTRKCDGTATCGVTITTAP